MAVDGVFTGNTRSLFVGVDMRHV